MTKRKKADRTLPGTIKREKNLQEVGIITPERRKKMVDGRKRNTKKLIEETVGALIYTNGNIAGASRKLEISESGLRSRMNAHKEIGQLISRLPNTAKLMLEASSEKASKTVIDLMDSKSERVKLDSARDVLDRTGVVKPETGTALQVNVFNKIKEDVDSFDL